MSMNVPTDFSKFNGKEFTPIPADNYPGVCIGVIDLGTHMDSYQGQEPKPNRKVKIQWELPSHRKEDGKTAVMSARYNLSFYENSGLRKMLNAWLGNDWPERFKGQSLQFLIGLPAMVNVECGPSKRDPNRKTNWVGSVTRYPKGMPAPEPEKDTFWLDLDDKHLPAVLSTWDAETIRESREYKAGGFTDDAPRPDNKANGSVLPAPPAAAEFNECAADSPF
jgi:hypothetical protein